MWGCAELVLDMSCLSGSGAEVLNAFHEEEKIEEAQQRRLPGYHSLHSERTERSRGWGRVTEICFSGWGERCAIRRSSRWIEDATIIDSRKR